MRDTINELKSNIGKTIKAIFMVMNLPYLKSGKLNEITADDIDVNGRIIPFRNLRRVETMPENTLIYYDPSCDGSYQFKKDTIFYNSRTGQFSSCPQEDKKNNRKRNRRK